MMNKLPDGLWPVMLTPFDENLKIDVGALKELTEFYILSGSSGLFANCLSSEMFHLSQPERILICKTVVEKSSQKVPVIATGSFGNDTTSISDSIKKIYDTGVHAVVISTNALVPESKSEDEFKTKLHALLSETQNIPLGLYECPVPYKRLISPILMKWIAETNRFLYHKDTCCDIDELYLKINAVKNSNLGIYNAHTPTGLKSYIEGAAGMSPIGANFYPELISSLLEKGNSKEFNYKLEEIQSFLIKMDPLIHNNYPVAAKIFLKKRGLKISSACRTIQHFPENKIALEMEELLKSFSELTFRLGIPLAQIN